MAYYNNEIMDNLIRMKEKLPFVHVDISTVNAQALSQISGNVGGGETTTSTKGLAGALRTVSRVVMEPFSYSVTPLHSDTLTMTGAPVIGQLAADNSEETTPTPTPTPTPSDSLPTPPPGFEESKRTTEVEGSNVKKTTLEFTQKKSTPKTTTIYAIYEGFRTSIADNSKVLVHSECRPHNSEVVPGTLKRYGTGYYYIRNDPAGDNQKAYTDLCTKLFTQSRGKASPKNLDKNLEQRLHQLDTLQAQPAPRPP